jgi:hypothetical protein
MVSNFSVPEGSGNYCDRGVRFGAHSSNESTPPVFQKKLAFITYFAGGVRALDCAILIIPGRSATSSRR